MQDITEQREVLVIPIIIFSHMDDTEINRKTNKLHMGMIKTGQSEIYCP
jgi:hypothetical protein